MYFGLTHIVIQIFIKQINQNSIIFVSLIELQVYIRYKIKQTFTYQL